METSSVIDMFCFILAVPQALAAAMFITDWVEGPKTGRAKMSLFRRSLAFIIVLGFGVTCIFGVWLYDHPIKLVTVVKPVPVPCLASTQKNGPATARGTGAIAHSGNGDNYNTPPSADKPQK